jgi:hypothetical protein
MSVTFKDYFTTISIYNLINILVALAFFGPLTVANFLGYNIILIFILLICDKLNFKGVFWFLKSE